MTANGSRSDLSSNQGPTQGATHFLTKTLPRVSTEMSLHVLAYNMKRVIKILGSAALMEAIAV
jgi:hypothetical protein